VVFKPQSVNVRNRRLEALSRVILY
jgi:hypothetical protein